MKRISWTITAAIIAGLFLPLSAAHATEPITNETQLLAIQNDLAGSYTLGASFSLTAASTGTYLTGEFIGTLNGNGFTISGLSAPLFDVIRGSVSNVNLKTILTVNGITNYSDPEYNAGVLAGRLASGGLVTGVNVAGALSVDKNNGGSAGGLIGQADNGSTISNSSSAVDIKSTGFDQTGGLVGWLAAGATITGSTSSGNVSTYSSQYGTGGLVGYMGYVSNNVRGTARIDNSASSGAVSGVDGYVGGLIGVVDSSGFNTVPGCIVTNSSASGSVTTSSGSYVGGLIGEAVNKVTINNVSATGNVIALMSEKVGGLIGYSAATVSNSYATGNVSGHIEVGGLIGYSSGNISNSRASGNVLGTKTLGGLVGGQWGTEQSRKLITQSSATGAVSGGEADADTNAGGLVGQLGLTNVSRSSASGSVTTIGGYQVGGLIGSARTGTQITDSNASGNVISNAGQVDGYAIGGFIGWAEGSNTLTNNTASGNVSGQYGVGGFIGNEGELYGDGAVVSTITSNSASGNVYATRSNSYWVGSFMGRTTSSSDLVDIWASGIVTALTIGTDVSNIVGVYAEGKIISVATVKPGPTQTVGSSATAVDLLNTGQTAAWGQNQYINGGVPYLLALIDRDFYIVTTPPVTPPAAVTEAQAKAAAAVAAAVAEAKREAEVKTARVDISNKLAKSENLTVDTFKNADIAGITADNFAEVQAELLALPAESRADVSQVLKVARKYEVVGKIASEEIARLPMNVFVEVGLIPADSKYKTSLIRAVRLASTSERDSLVEIKAVIALEAAKIQARQDRLAALVKRVKS